MGFKLHVILQIYAGRQTIGLLYNVILPQCALHH